MKETARLPVNRSSWSGEPTIESLILADVM